jgi:hypothetical protein
MMDPVPVVRRYRKKPVSVDAMHLSSSSVIGGARSWMLDFGYLPSLVTSDGSAVGLLIPTLEGEMMASLGDYIIRGVKGEFYPCKPDIFVATYDPE